MSGSAVRFHRALIAACLALATTAAHAVLSISEPWVRAAPDGRSAELFMNVTSSDTATLTGIDSFAARRSGLRSAKPARALTELPLPAGAMVALAPDGPHVRLDGLTRRLKFGEYVPVTLLLRGADGAVQTAYINAEVRHRSPTDDERSPHAHGPHAHGR